MRTTVIAVAFSALLLAGCAQGVQGEAPPATPARLSSVEQAADFSPPSDDPSVDRLDASGRTPEQALLALIDATNAGDHKARYSMYAAPELDFETAAREWDAAKERYARFLVQETRVVDVDTAWLRVTYEASTTPPGGERYPVVVDEPGEWWPLHRVDGLWKVQWLPRQ